MAIFKGAGVAIITPFNKDFSINYDQLKNIIDYQIDHGTDAIIICGTTGESSTMSHEEHIECIRFAVEVTNGRVPVIAGSGSNSTEEAIHISKAAEAAGADALLCVTPYYNKCTQQGLYEYYKDISDNVNIPIIMYNVPSRTGTNILPETAVRIAREVKNVVAIKEASGNISQVAKLSSLANGDIDIYSGNDDQIVPLLSLGGIGVISVLSNVAPQYTHDLVAKYLEGDVNTSRDMQLKALDLCGALFCEVNPIPVKAAMNMLGFCEDVVRKPLTSMEANHKEMLSQAMKDFGIL